MATAPSTFVGELVKIDGTQTAADYQALSRLLMGDEAPGTFVSGLPANLANRASL